MRANQPPVRSESMSLPPVRGRGIHPTILVVLTVLGLSALLQLRPAMAQDPAEPAVMIIDLQGRADINDVPLDVLAELPAGTVIDLSTETRLVAVGLTAGREYRVAGPGTATVGADGLTVAGGATLDSSEPPTIEPGVLQVAAVQQAAVVMRGAAPNALAMEPNGLRVLDPPTLTWAAADGVPAYQVVVVGPDNGISFTAAVEEARVAVPPDAITAPGRYSWAVRYVAGDNRLVNGSATFTVVTPDVRTAIAAADEAFGNDVAGRVRYARFLADHKVDARAVWDWVAAQRPDSRRLTIQAGR